MLQGLTTNMKLALFGVFLLIVGAIGYGAYSFIDRNGKIEVTVNAVPSDAHITFNDVSTGAGTIYLKEGKYIVKGTKEGFNDFSTSIYIDKDHHSVNVPLVASSDSAKQWQKDNLSKYTDLEGSAGQAANDEGEAFATKNPITTVLPFENLIYTIGYRADPSDPTGNSIILEIDAAEGYRNAAVEQIRNLGYDPTDFKINFRDYKNPFSS
jgi:hypothetical protein